MLVELGIVQQRYDAVMEVLRDGLSVTEVAARYNASRHSVHRWINKYKSKGMDGLVDRPHKPISCPHKMTKTTEAKICKLRRAHPSWGPKRLVHELSKGKGPVPAQSSVYRALIRNGLIEPGKRRRRPSDYLRWERPRPMQLFQMDVMGVVKLADGTKLMAVTAIDDHSRFCVSAKFVQRATSRAVCSVFADTLARFGIPEQVLTDNGKVFTGRFGATQAEVLFDRICRENGIDHILTGVRSPTTTGKIERFHRTLRAELFSKAEFQTIEQAQAALDKFVRSYNNVRPHQSIGMATPASRFHDREEKQQLSQELVTPAETRTGTNYFGKAITRRVSPGGRVSVAGGLYFASIRLAGKLVKVDLVGDLVHIYHGKTLLKVHPRRHFKEIRTLKANRRLKSDGQSQRKVG